MADPNTFWCPSLRSTVTVDDDAERPSDSPETPLEPGSPDPEHVAFVVAGVVLAVTLLVV